jgi:tetratricopeptide (TPR) repeat protein
MQENAEPPKPCPRQRHVARWVFLTLLMLLFASIAVVFVWGESEKMPQFVQIWGMRCKVLSNQVRFGRDNRAAIWSRHDLAYGLRLRGRVLDGEKELADVVRTQERVFGPEDSDSMELRLFLALYLEEEQKFAEAEQVYRKLLLTEERLYDPKHPRAGHTLIQLARNMRAQGKREQALEFARRGLEAWRKGMGADHWLTQEAEKLCQELHEKK